jgi:hypothetical protein
MFLFLSCSNHPRREKFPGAEGATVGGNPGSARAVLGGFDPNAKNIPVEQEKSHVKTLDDDQRSVSGKVEATPGLKFSPSATVFILVRPPGGGRPLAVKKFVARELPIEFSLSQADAMVPDSPFEGDVEVVARIDHDGNAWTRDDIDSEALLATKVGNHKIHLIFTKTLGAQK